MTKNQFNMWQAMAAHQKATGIKSYDLTALVVPIKREEDAKSKDSSVAGKDTKEPK